MKKHLSAIIFLFLLVSSKSLFGQGPAISYSTPQVYVTGTAIAPLVPINTRNPVGTQSFRHSGNVGSGFINPVGAAADANGNVYIADAGTSITEIPVGGGSPIALGSGFNTPAGVAVDGYGNVFVADAGNNAVKEIPAAGGAVITLGSGFNAPAGVAVDAAGNVYVADAGNNAVKKIPASGGSPVTLGSGFSSPQGVCVDGSGNVYVADIGNLSIKEIPVGGGNPITLPGAWYANGIAIDAAGNLYVAVSVSKEVFEIPVGGGASFGINSDFTDPLYANGIAIDGLGNIFVAIEGSDLVKKIAPYGGYYISPFLPAGLSFDSNTGILSGIPTTASPSANYRIAAYNSAGESNASVNITVKPLPPTISYASPDIFSTGHEIALLYPISSGVAAPGYSSTPLDIGAGFGGPSTVAVDAAGNVFVTDPVNNVVYKVPVAGGVPVAIGSGINGPSGVALDNAGNVYVADFYNNAIKEILATDGSTVAIGAGFNQPRGVATDATGNVYVADAGNNAVKKIPAGGGAPVIMGSGFLNPSGIAVDGAGNVYVADYGHDVVKEIPVGGGAPVTIGSGFGSASGVAVDASGNVYVADFTGNAITKIPVGGGASVTIGSGFKSPNGVAIDGLGNIFVADYGNSLVKEFKPVGGYYLSRMLPAGLSLDGATGIISGPLNALSPATNYLVTGYNAGGSASATVNITVVVNVDLFSLTTSSGTLSPAFESATTSYTASVANTVNSITVTAVRSDPNGETIINNNNGTINQPTTVNLNVGINIITVVVYGRDPSFTQTYTITVIRAPSANDNLSTLGQSTGPLIPAFSGGTTSYASSVSNATASMTLKPVSSDANATIKVNGTVVASGTVTAPIALAVGPNTITTVVTAQNGTTVKTYTLTVTRIGSNNANLTKLGPGIGGLTPSFSSGTINYTISTGNATATMTLTPVASDANATIKVNGTTVTSGTVTAPIALPEGGKTVINTVVTAQDGTTTKTYILTVTRAASINAGLSALKLSSGTLTPVFATATTGYAVSVANSVSTITITPTTTDANATVKVNGTSLTSGTVTGPIALAEGGQTVINTVVTAQDGSTTKTYTVTVTRAPSTNASLSKLGPSIIGLTPAFSSSTTSYTISTGNATASMKLTPVSIDANATIKVNGTAVASGTTTAPIALAVGPNTITTVVTSQNGATTKTYTLTVTRASGGADGYVPIAIGPGISVTIPIAIGTTETPTLAEDGTQVHQGLSPNGDGINDFLQIDNISQYPDNKLMIMNRNGQLIYEANGYDNSSKVFDGHSNKNGQMQLPGTYFYQLDYTANGITKHKTGFIVLKY